MGIASHYYDILLRGAEDSRVDVLQGSGNLLERGMLDRLRREHKFGFKGFLVNKVYAAGILPAFFPVRTLIRSVLSYPVSSALIGIGTTEQAKAAMGWDPVREQGGLPSFEEVLSALEKDYEPIPCDRCQRCICPYGTEIHTLFRQYQYYFLGKEYWALRKLDLGIEKSAQYCRECEKMPCMDQCPRRIRIPDELRKVRRLVREHPTGWRG